MTYNVFGGTLSLALSIYAQMFAFSYTKLLPVTPGHVTEMAGMPYDPP